MRAFQGYAQWQRFVQVALQWFSSAQTSRAFSSWQAAAKRRRRLRQAMHVAAARWQQLLLGSALRQWQAVAAWSAFARTKIQMAINQWRARTVVAVWAAWRQYAAGKLEKRERMSTAVAHWAGNTVQLALRGWFEVCVALKDAHAHWYVSYITAMHAAPCDRSIELLERVAEVLEVSQTSCNVHCLLSWQR